MTDSKPQTAISPRSQVAQWVTTLSQCGLDAHETNPRLLRQIRVLNGLMLTAMGLCIPLGLFWAIAVDSNFSYVYL
ncbi:MAG: hypothetical protein AB8B93_00550, partial [Pseudomonadales bacterium]